MMKPKRQSVTKRTDCSCRSAMTGCAADLPPGLMEAMAYLPPRVPLTPKQAAERRVRRIAVLLRVLLWAVAVVPLLFMAMAYGYSDQAPAGLRSATMMLDGWLGSPVWKLIGPKS
jgi:hypothetical protein